jgi:hypothetical protein
MNWPAALTVASLFQLTAALFVASIHLSTRAAGLAWLLFTSAGVCGVCAAAFA